jgi:hypothetical protein
MVNEKKSRPMAVAYFNLGLVFLAILVIAFWRWGS